ncbi:MAG: restriction endonuclease [Bacteroidetes bacterium]|nr:restriction endonuclease [Bacteroidota bacterium]
MLDYNFLILSPHEFENISRDLLQKKLSIFIESFTTGRDGGIDLRYSKNKAKKIIIQAKRYKDYNSLYNHLKVEVAKVKKLSPDKYILTTSVGLTPNNKEEIKTLFSPYIKNTEGIIGKDDLNNLLGLYNDIERKYYKLWLSSTNILEKVLHSKIYNQSAFELEEIREQVKLYVPNDSFYEALRILKEHRYVIISGIPGIGKTTLARMLILYLLSEEFDEFVFLSQSIDDGYEYFDDGKKQVFFFDDFLGKNFFEGKKAPNDDNKIVKFIEKIKKSPDKVLILATREYILNQAKIAFEAFNINNIEIAKCVLDLSTYTNIIKAQIIYNHLFFAEVPIAHLENLVDNKNYLQLVHHANYSPRIIETVINRKIWEHCSPEQFAEAFTSYFDNPESVWLYAFENSLDKFSQYALIVLLSMGTPVLIEDWEQALKEFLTINSYKFFISFDSINFNRAVRELENTFIKTQKDTYNKIAVDYQNPSIQDFLVNYLKDKKDLIKCIIEGAIHSNQFFSVFTTDTSDTYSNRRKVVISSDLVDIAIHRIQQQINSLRKTTVSRFRYSKSNNFFWYSDSHFIYSFLYKIYSEFAEMNSGAKEFVYAEFQKRIYINTTSYSEQRAYLNLLIELDKTKLTYNEEQIIDSFIKQLPWVYNFEIFKDFKNIFATTYNDTISGENFRKTLEKVINDEVKSVEDSDSESLREKIVSLEEEYDLSFEKQVSILEKKEQDYSNYLEVQAEGYIDDRRGASDENKGDDDENVIGEIFNSLIDK